MTIQRLRHTGTLASGFLLAVLLGTISRPVAAANADDWYAKAVKDITFTATPAEAKPGEVVTLKITVKLNDGYHTYPTKQDDKNAASMINKITFLDGTALIAVGPIKDPIDFETKAEPELGITDLRTNHGDVVYERKAVVSPKAKAGQIEVKLKALRLSICDKTNCFPAKTVTPMATFKVLPGEAVAVPKEFAEEVKLALENS